MSLQRVSRDAKPRKRNNHKAITNEIPCYVSELKKVQIAPAENAVASKPETDNEIEDLSAYLTMQCVAERAENVHKGSTAPC